MTKKNIHHFIRNEPPGRLTAVVIAAVVGFVIVFLLTKERSFYYAIAAALVVGAVMYLHSIGWQNRAKSRAK